MLIEYTVHTVQDGEHKIIIEIVVKDVQPERSRTPKYSLTEEWPLYIHVCE